MDCTRALAQTGVAVSGIALAGLVVLVVGVALTVAARHRTTGRAHHALVIGIILVLLLALDPRSSGAATSASCAQSPASPPAYAVTRPVSSCDRVTLSADRASAELGSPITFVASAPTGLAPGVVTFWDGTRTLGTVGVQAGSAVLSIDGLGVGAHRVFATFTPVVTASCVPDGSVALIVIVNGTTAGSGGSSDGGDVQAIQARIGAGILLLRSPYDAEHPLDLGVLRLAGSADQYVGRAQFGDGSVSGSLSIIDTRGGDAGWTVCVQGGDLGDPAGDLVSGSNFGFINVAAISWPGGPRVTVGDRAGPTTAVAPGTAIGLGAGPQVIARSVGSGAGTVGLSGLVTLVAPLSSAPGTYSGTLTFTVG